MTEARTFGAQSMVAPLRTRPRQAARAGVRAGVPGPGARLPAPGRPAASAAGARRAGGAADGPRRAGRDPGRRVGQRRRHLHVRPAAGGRPGRHRPPQRPGEPAGGDADPRRLDDRPRHPDPRHDRGTGHGRWRRHVLAAAGPPVHRPRPAHERRRCAAARCAGDRRRQRGPHLRPALLARAGRTAAPPVGHLAGRQRPRRGLRAAPAGRPVGAARRPGHPAARRARTRSSRRWAATCWRSDRASWSWPRGTRTPGRRSRPPVARSMPSRRRRSASTVAAGRPA